ncbi:MAG: hypothetical protein WD770_03315 [Actinomycetota bacterium]
MEDRQKPPEEIGHEVVRKFVAMRSQEPIGFEKIQPLTTLSDVYSLHAGRWRGATWHDRTHGVVWLVGARLHRSGDSDDAYPTFKALDAANELGPTEEDYRSLFDSRAETFVDEVMRVVPPLLGAARQQSPREVSASVGGIAIAVATESHDGIELRKLSIAMNSWGDGQTEPPKNWTEILWAAVFPWVADWESELSLEDDIGGRAARDSELIYSAMREES